MSSDFSDSPKAKSLQRKLYAVIIEKIMDTNVILYKDKSIDSVIRKKGLAYERKDFCTRNFWHECIQ